MSELDKNLEAPVNSVEQHQDRLAAAQDAINQDRQARSDACSRAIAQTLAEYGCEVRCPVQVIDGRLVASPIVVAL